MKLSGETKESATQVMREMKYNDSAISQYLDDAVNGGSTRPIGPVEKITYSRKTSKYVIHIREN
jgi:hypothetical protein